MNNIDSKMTVKCSRFYLGNMREKEMKYKRNNMQNLDDTF